MTRRQRLLRGWIRGVERKRRRRDEWLRFLSLVFSDDYEVPGVKVKVLFGSKTFEL